MAKPLPTIHDTRPKRHSKHRSSIASEIFQKNDHPLRDTGLGRIPAGKAKSRPLNSKESSSHHIQTNIIPHTLFQSRKQRAHRLQDEDYEELDEIAPVSRNLSGHAVGDNDDDGGDKSVSDADESEEDEDDWLDGSTLIAPYQEEESETEDDRTLALVEYLQVPMQEKSQAIKQDMCDLLINTINEIRQTQQRLELGADVDRGKGIIVFNDACDRRHVDTSHAHAELKDTMADNQAEIEKLFVQLKQAYTRRGQLWIDLRMRIEEITKLQTSLLDQLDDNMARTITALEKKGKALLKDDAGKEKEKLLRGVLGKL